MPVLPLRSFLLWRGLHRTRRSLGTKSHGVVQSHWCPDGRSGALCVHWSTLFCVGCPLFATRHKSLWMRGREKPCDSTYMRSRLADIRRCQFLHMMRGQATASDEVLLYTLLGDLFQTLFACCPDLMHLCGGRYTQLTVKCHLTKPYGFVCDRIDAQSNTI